MGLVRCIALAMTVLAPFAAGPPASAAELKVVDLPERLIWCATVALNAAAMQSEAQQQTARDQAVERIDRALRAAGVSHAGAPYFLEQVAASDTAVSFKICVNVSTATEPHAGVEARRARAERVAAIVCDADDDCLEDLWSQLAARTSTPEETVQSWPWRYAVSVTALANDADIIAALTSTKARRITGEVDLVGIDLSTEGNPRHQVAAVTLPDGMSF